MAIQDPEPFKLPPDQESKQDPLYVDVQLDPVYARYKKYEQEREEVPSPETGLAAFVMRLSLGLLPTVRAARIFLFIFVIIALLGVAFSLREALVPPMTTEAAAIVY